MRIILTVVLFTKIFANTIIDEPSSTDVPVGDGFSEKTWESADDIFTEKQYQVPVEMIDEFKGSYKYASYGKADPFTPPYRKFFKKEVKSAIDIPIVSPLQINISDLEVRGIWQNADQSWQALILNNGGQGVVASVGDPIGLTGKIVDIDKNQVMTRQFSMKEDGSREFEDFAIQFIRYGGKKTTGSLMPSETKNVKPVPTEGSK